MKTPLLLEKPLYQPMYRIQSAERHVAICSPYANSIGLLRDAEPEGWEAFDEKSLVSYFTNGLKLARANIAKLEKLSESYSERDANELAFMMESLVQARQLLEEISKQESAS